MSQIIKAKSTLIRIIRERAASGYTGVPGHYLTEDADIHSMMRYYAELHFRVLDADRVKDLNLICDELKLTFHFEG